MNYICMCVYMTYFCDEVIQRLVLGLKLDYYGQDVIIDAHCRYFPCLLNIVRVSNIPVCMYVCMYVGMYVCVMRTVGISPAF